MKQKTKTAFLISFVLFISSCSSGVKLGNSGCKLTANYTAAQNSAYGCIICDSVSQNALRALKKVFPKQSFLNNFNQH